MWLLSKQLQLSQLEDVVATPVVSAAQFWHLKAEVLVSLGDVWQCKRVIGGVDYAESSCFAVGDIGKYGPRVALVGLAIECPLLGVTTIIRFGVTILETCLIVPRAQPI